MAGIDKVYGTAAQWWELHRWLLAKRALHRANMYGLIWHEGDDPNAEHVICNNSQEQDMWLMKHCPIKWLRARLKRQYGSLNYRVIKKYDTRFYRWYKKGNRNKMLVTMDKKNKYVG